MITHFTSKAQADAYLAPPPAVPWKTLGIITFLLVSLFAGYRYYQELTSFSVGLDYFEPEFQIYWMNLLYTQLVVEALVFVGLVGYLWKTRDKNVLQVTAQEELRRYYVLLCCIVGFSTISYLAASLYTEADAAWHQVTVRDTDFTPTHIALFYFGIPTFIILGVSTFVYAHTRLPQFHNRVSAGLALLVAGPILIMPNLGFNEWGHTFFYAEELFAAPVHWGFVLLGWSAFAAGGFLIQIITRMITLSSLEGDQKVVEA